jgi:glycosyltransferase involved in cell wall biosynthesis
MNANDLVSVVITTYNRSDALVRVLDGLLQQTDKNFEVIVADDGSTTAHQKTLAQSQAAIALRVIHVWHPDVGFTASRIRNRGVAAASGSYIVLMDGDCIPETDFIARHRSLAQPGHLVNGSRVLLSPDLTRDVLSGAVNVSGRSAFYWLVARLQGHANKLGVLCRLPDGLYRVRQLFSWKGIRSCNMGVWRSDLEAVDGFDESFVGWGHEDADFVLRLHNHRVLRKDGYCATEVFHLHHKEAARDQESQNASTVRLRAQTKVTQPLLGFSQIRVNDDAVITRLG